MSGHPPVHFVVPKLSRAEAAAADWRLYFDGQYSWVAQTYHQLRAGWPDITMSEHPKAGAINVAHSRTWQALPPLCDIFKLVCQADWPRVPWAQLHVVQNKLQAARRAFWVPHWPQADLKPRRGPVGTPPVRRVGYFGRVDRPDMFNRFRADLEQMGLTFVVRAPDDWNDYSDIDAAISLRFLSAKRIDRKPPTKLVNAWLAGVPFIAMDEPAFGQIGRAGVDYIAAQTPEDVCREIAELNACPTRWQQLIAAGHLRTQDYDFAAVRKAWQNLLAEPAARAYESWCAGRRYDRIRSLAAWGRSAALRRGRAWIGR